MSDILQYKALSNEIEEALNEKVIGEVKVHVGDDFNPPEFGTVIMVSIDEPHLWEMKSSYYRNDLRWHHFVRFKLNEFTIKDSFDNLKLISEIVNDVLYNYKEYIYKRYFFD